MKKFWLIILSLVAVIFLVVLMWLNFLLPVRNFSGVVKSEKVVKIENIITTTMENILPTKKDVPIEKETVITFGGDVMLSRVVGQKMVKYNDYTWSFKNIADVFSSADLAVVNLESPFSISKNYTVPTGSFLFNVDPRAMAGLKLAGIDLVDLANNHFGNMGQKGMSATMKILTSSTIGYVGAGINEIEAASPKIFTINNIKFGFLAYGYPNDGTVAGQNSPGLATMDLIKAKKEIQKLKMEADVVVVMMHAGTEYTAEANWQQKEFAHGVIDAGADLVIGHHPHWVQKMETYHGKPILYSLGNLIFDQMWSQTTREGMIARTYFKNNKLEKIEFLPIEIEDYGQPKLVSDERQKEKIWKQIGATTSEINF